MARATALAHSPAIRRRVQARTRLVFWAKILLPLAGLALLAALFLSARDRGDLSDLFTPEELARLSAGLRLDNPRLAGVTKNGEPFAIRADWVLPDGAVPHHLQVARPVGEVTLSDGTRLTLRAEKGHVDRIRRTVRLEDRVELRWSDGYRLTTGRMDIDVGAETAVAPGPVRIEGTQGSLAAGRMRVRSGENGLSDGNIWFENGVRVVFIPPDAGRRRGPVPGPDGGGADAKP